MQFVSSHIELESVSSSKSASMKISGDKVSSSGKSVGTW